MTDPTTVQPTTIPTLHCKRCGYDWIPRTSNPQMCPSCKHRDWNSDKPTEVSEDVDDK